MHNQRSFLDRGLDRGALVLAALLFGCGSNGSNKAYVGEYQVMISAMGKSDPDLVSVTEGRSGALLLEFAAGIVATAGSESGLRASRDGSNLSIGSQAVRIDHSTGPVEGMVKGSGLIQSFTGGKLSLKLQFTGGDSTTDYTVDGSRE